MLPLTMLRTQIKWILAVFIVIFTVSILFMYGSGSSQNSSGRSGDFVAARIDGDDLHISTLQERLRVYVERNGIRDLSDKQLPLIYKAVLDEIVSERALNNEAARLKISVPAADVDAQLKAIESQYVTREQYMQVLRSQNRTLKQVKDDITRVLAVQKMLDDVSGGVVVSEVDIAKLYDMLKGNYTQPAGIEADFAILKSKEAAEKLIAAAKSDTWDNAVKTVTADVVYASKADKPERIPSATMTEKFEPVSKLADGEFCSPIESESNTYVIRRLRAVPETTIPLSEVSDELKNILLQSKKLEVQRNYTKELADKLKVEIVAEELFTVPNAEQKPAETSAAQKAEAGSKPDTAGAETNPAPAQAPKPAEVKKNENTETPPAKEEAAEKPAEESKKAE